VLAVVGVEGRIRCKREEVEGILLACRLSVSLIIVYFRICKELTEMICVSKLGRGASADLNVMILIAVKGQSPA
jgi:hypothetical protein